MAEVNRKVVITLGGKPVRSLVLNPRTWKKVISENFDANDFEGDPPGIDDVSHP